MGFWELVVLAVGLSMDAFAVSICKGLALQRVSWKECCIAGAWFGGFQALMPLLGYLLGTQFEQFVTSVDHWIAFGLLVFIGGKMLWEVLRGGEDDAPRGDPCGWMNLLVMAVATSIDAMAVGVSLAVMPHTGMLSGDYGYLLCCAVIAAVTFVICAVGVKIGCKTGDMFGRKAEIAGGIVLIGIGVKILLEHLMGG